MERCGQTEEVFWRRNLQILVLDEGGKEKKESRMLSISVPAARWVVVSLLKLRSLQKEPTLEAER